VQAKSALEPTVLLVDDAHWIDAESDALLAEMVDALGWTRTLLLVNFRPDYSADWMRVSYYRSARLEPLPRDAADSLVRELVGTDAGLEALSAKVAERAEGNPFFIEEIVRSLVDEGVLLRRAGRVRLARPVGELSIPETVQAVLAARIDRLPEPVKLALQTAAVIGRSFAEPVLREVLGAGAELVGALRLLERSGLIERSPGEEPGRLAFHHSLTQEVAYLSQLSETRARIHERVARALEALHADRLGERAAELAHHFAAAGRRYEARLWRQRAALRVTTIQLGRGARREPRPGRGGGPRPADDRGSRTP
jgi:adenylate cyclase